MERCLDCEQVGNTCICDRVDKLFDEGREAEARVNRDLVDLPDPFETWFIAGRVAMVLVAITCLNACSSSRGSPPEVGYTDKQATPSPSPSPIPAQVGISSDQVVCTMVPLTGGVQITCLVSE